MKTKTRTVLDVKPYQGYANVKEWTDEQRRLAGGWSKHELQSRDDPMCAAYEWIPGWTRLTAEQIQDQLADFYHWR